MRMVKFRKKINVSKNRGRSWELNGILVVFVFISIVFKYLSFRKKYFQFGTQFAYVDFTILAIKLDILCKPFDIFS